MDRAAMKYPEQPQIPNFEGSRSVARPKLWWMDSMAEDLRKFGIEGWQIVAGVGNGERGVLQETEVCFGP